jgi:hypothetical protein
MYTIAAKHARSGMVRTRPPTRDAARVVAGAQRERPQLVRDKPIGQVFMAPDHAIPPKRSDTPLNHMRSYSIRQVYGPLRKEGKVCIVIYHADPYIILIPEAEILIEPLCKGLQSSALVHKRGSMPRYVMSASQSRVG